MSQSGKISSLIKGTGYLTVAKGFSAGLGFLSIIIVAPKLGAEEFGFFSLIVSYVLIIDRLFNFQSWQALIKHGIESIEKENISEYRGFVKFSFCIDVVSALVACVFAIITSDLLGFIFGWQEKTIDLIKIYSISILFNISGSALGVLRINNCFLHIALADTASAFAKVVAILGSYLSFYDLNLQLIIIIWLSTEVFHKFLLLYLALVQIGGKEARDIIFTKLKPMKAQIKGFFKVLLLTNLEGAVRVLRDFDIFFVTYLLNEASAGIFRLAKQLGQLISIYVEPMYQVVYPELTKKVSRKEYDQFFLLSTRWGGAAALLTVFASLGITIFAPFLIDSFLGHEFESLNSLLVWVLIAMVLWSLCFPVSPALMALGEFKGFFWRNLFATLLYFPLFWILVSIFGLTGSGMAILLFYATWCGLMVHFSINALQAAKNKA